MKILFMGTPDFALFSLKAIVESNRHTVCGVITQPDKPKGRGYNLIPPPVKAYALEIGLPVYQPSTLKGEEFASLLSELDPEIIVVAAYGKILPKNVLDYPEYGCINVHGSLLPQYRGAAPMQRAIIDGNAVTGVTIMYMAEGLDTGDMILKRELAIEENHNFEDVHDGLGKIGASALIDAISLIENGKAEAIAQDDSLSSYAEKITKETCLVDFSLDAKTVHNLIRGLSPIPLAFTHTENGRLLKLVQAKICDRATVFKTPGEVLEITNDGIEIACGVGSIMLLKVLPEGKSRMNAVDFARGRGIRQGEILK